jgi:tetrapyrrole methylase family protein/MazG family protein
LGDGELCLTGNEAFTKLYETIVRLRAPGGCSWDREQTPLSLRGDLIEETYECVEALGERDPDHIKEELGDIFLLVTMLAYMYEQEGVFSVADTLQEISEKLIRRHPHVFNKHAGPEPDLSTGEILKNWAKMKVEQEGRKPKDSILDEVSKGLPPMERAWKLQKKAAKKGFDWPKATGVIDKIKEELAEVEIAAVNDGNQEALALEGELGDLLFSVVNLCRFFDIDPSVALQRTNTKFIERFKYVEKRMKENCREMNAQNLAVMDQYWNEAK